MTAKNEATAKQKYQLEIAVKPGEDRNAVEAKSLLRPTVNAALLTAEFGMRQEGPSLMSLINELAEQCSMVKAGDLSRPESILLSQAHALDAIFTRLAYLANQNLFSQFDCCERLLKLALRSQSQCRATLEALSAIKNPPVVIARQANVSSGPQQVNNGLAREIPVEQNKLLEQSNGTWLEPRSTSQAGRSNQAMATVGAINRPTNGRGETS
jgi:hypothetical protein